MQRLPQIALFLCLFLGCKAKWAHTPKGQSTCWPVTHAESRLLQVTGPRRARVGTCTGPYQITSYSEVPGKQCTDGTRQEPSPGTIWPVAQETEIFLSDTQSRGSFYLEGTCSNAIQSIVLRENTSTLAVYYKYYRLDFTGDSSNTSINADASPSGIGPGKLDLLIDRPN